MKPRVALAILGVIAATEGLAVADVAPGPTYPPHGPLVYRNAHPLYLQVPQVPARRPIGLPKGVFEVGVQTSYSNIFEQFTTAQHDVLIDMEQLRQAFTLAYGMGDGFTVAFELPLVHTSGGFLDGFLEGYHNAFHFPNAGRENFPRDQFVLRVRDTTTTFVDAQVSGYRLADSHVRVQQQVIAEGARRPAFGWFAILDMPTGARSRELGNGDVDLGFGALAEKSYRRWHGYLNLGYFVTTGHPQLGDFVHTNYFGYLLGGEFSASRRVSLHAQLHGGTPLMTGMGDSRWDDPPLDLAFGVSGDHPKRLWGKDLFWNVGLSEDLHADGPSIDFTLFGQVGVRLGRAR